MDPSRSTKHAHALIPRLCFAATLISAAWLIFLAISGAAPPFPTNPSSAPAHLLSTNPSSLSAPPVSTNLSSAPPVSTSPSTSKAPPGSSNPSMAEAPPGSTNPLMAEALPVFTNPSSAPPAVPCTGRYVYIHDLPSHFNADILKDCRNLSPLTDMCRSIANSGLGPPIHGGGGVLPGDGWYATDQFTLEVIFHSRIRRYECLTPDASAADAVYVPFYAGLDVARHLLDRNVSARDELAGEVIRWLTARPEWAAMGGRDHFLAVGRVTWDFRRATEEEGSWGSNFLMLPAAKNMSALVIESTSWHENDFGVPYPTYFHPSSDAEVFAWQERIRATRRPWLFSFAGAPRPGEPNSIRTLLMDQCRSSAKCKLLDCVAEPTNCAPASIMQAFSSSVFCLQPPGDSFTRRSTFDTMVAGCVPVFFHPASAYKQYEWYLPKEHNAYSVFIPEADVRRGNVSIEEVLSRSGDGEVERMREEVIRTMPRLIYSHPRARLTTVKDAFDVALEGVLERVRRFRER